MAVAYNLHAIDVLAELDRLGVEHVAQDGGREVKIVCPVHDDNKPSLSINLEKRLFRCLACQVAGDMVLLLRYLEGRDRSDIIADLRDRVEGFTDKSPISTSLVEDFHEALLGDSSMLYELRVRGVTQEMVRTARLGLDAKKGRIQIPVWEGRSCLNLRSYRPGARNRKFMNKEGYGRARLYRKEDLRHERVWICGGELKALAVGELLKGHDIGAVSSTGGEGHWAQEWGALFKGKRVWLCYDIDAAGVSGAKQVAAILSQHAESIHMVTLPLDPKKYPKGDVSDYLGRENGDADGLLALMEQAKEYTPPQVRVVEEKGHRSVMLRDTYKADNLHFGLTYEASVTAIEKQVFHVPKVVSISCPRDQKHLCAECSVWFDDPDPEGMVFKRLPMATPFLADMVNTTKPRRVSGMRSSLGIPSCRVVNLRVTDSYTVTDVRLSPIMSVENAGPSGETERVPALCMDIEPQLGGSYRFEGRVHTDQETGAAYLVAENAEELEDTLETFQLGEADLSKLEIFRPDGDSLADLEWKLKEVYEDLEANVTKIYDRRDMHMVMDLVWHSPLYITYRGDRIPGWVNALVIGDSAQGKSETRLRLQEHYRAGETVDCKNASVAGLLGGMQQLGNRWFTTWGRVPMADRRMLSLEELKGAKVRVISALTEVRSSGVAEIAKIERSKTFARTRLLFISNPRDEKSMSDHAYGVEAVLALMGAREDMRRLEVAIAVSSGEVDLGDLDGRQVVHKYTSDLCHQLVLWAWTVSSVVFSTETLQEVSVAYKFLTEKYTEDFPLVDKGTCRQKLMRLSAALAARVFSCHDGELVVEPRHVQCVVRLLDRCYSSPSMGYDEMSMRRSTQVQLQYVDNLRAEIKTKARSWPHLVECLLEWDQMAVSDIQVAANLDQDQARGLIHALTRSNALKRTGHVWRKTPAAIPFFKDLLDEYRARESGSHLLG